MESAACRRQARRAHSLAQRFARGGLQREGRCHPARALRELRERLEALEELLPDASDVQLDQT
jgi:hypothetical protein